ncbi:unnamed protein product [Calicophoron daubneyi]|uniref:RRM domain-containing protein n=1 Tax=Calicophoron daubneyi TaxID=300641 RepID=A0AAV2T312_CALDB
MPQLTNIHTPKSDHSTVKKKKDKNRDSLNSSLTLKPSHPPGKVDHGVKRACPGGEDSDEEEQVFHKRPRVQSTDLDAKRMRTTDSSQKGKDHKAGQTIVDAKQGKGEEKNRAGEKTALLAAIRKRLVELDARTLYVRRLPRGVNPAQLKSLCPTSVSGRVQSNRFASKRKHAFVEFKSEEMARAALASIDGKLIGDKPITAVLCIERADKHTAQNATGAGAPHWIPPNERRLEEFCLTNLHVACIPRVTTPEEIHEVFPKAESISFNMNPKRKEISSCRVIYSAEKDALEAFQKCHDTLLHDTPLNVNFAFKKHFNHKRRTAVISDPMKIKPKKADESEKSSTNRGQTNVTQVTAKAGRNEDQNLVGIKKKHKKAGGVSAAPHVQGHAKVEFSNRAVEDGMKKKKHHKKITSSGGKVKNFPGLKEPIAKKRKV